MVIALIFRDVAKHLTLGGGGGGGYRRTLPEIRSSMLRIYLKYNNYIIEVFLIDFHCDTKFAKKGGAGCPPPENVYIFEAPLSKHYGYNFTKITTLLIICKFYLKMSKFILELSFTVRFTPPNPLSISTSLLILDS